jgi:DNA-binding CsgD family transcriptional regulator/GAF domain-containing protein
MAQTGSRVEFIRARDAGAPWPGRGYLLPPDRKGELGVLLTRLTELTDLNKREEDVVDYASAHDALHDAWECSLAAIEEAAQDPGRAGEIGPLTTMLRALKSFDDRLRDERLHHRDDAFARVREALAALRRVEGTVELVQSAAIAVASLGFDRVIVSRVEEGHWVPETVYIGRDPRWAEEILAIGRAARLPLDDSLAETEMVRRGVALLVSDVQDTTSAVNRPIAEASLSRSYVAAPIVAYGSVIGFVHADCYYQRRNLDETDRDVLATFGEGLGYALARTAVLDRLRALRQDLGNLAAGVTTAVPSADWSTAGAPASDPLANKGFLDALRAVTAHAEPLTDREQEVLRHLAAGETNGRIARRLMITEGTVKTHVKNILRKLGAANRAEAASRWVQMQRQD